MQFNQLISLLGDEAESLLSHRCQKIPQQLITPPSPEHLERAFGDSSRSSQVRARLQRLYMHGRLGGSGYLSIFPVDQGVEHTAAYSFYRNPAYFDPETVFKMAVESGASGVATTLGIVSMVAAKYADHIPIVLKLNHNELLTYPNKHDQRMYARVKQAAEMGCVGVGATIYFGSAESNRQIEEVSQAFEEAHRQGLFTMLWCYPRNPAFREGETDVTTGVDLTSQACHLGVTLGADIIKQKMPSPVHAFAEKNFAKYTDEMYQQLLTDHPVDLVRYQVLNCFAGKISLVNSGGGATGAEDDVKSVLRTAVINKRAGGAGLIVGRKIFNRSFEEGVQLLRDIQDVYLSPEVTLA